MRRWGGGGKRRGEGGTGTELKINSPNEKVSCHPAPSSPWLTEGHCCNDLTLVCPGLSVSPCSITTSSIRSSKGYSPTGPDQSPRRTQGIL